MPLVGSELLPICLRLLSIDADLPPLAPPFRLTALPPRPKWLRASYSKIIDTTAPLSMY